MREAGAFSQLPDVQQHSSLPLRKSISLPNVPRGRCEHQSKMKDPQIRNARGRNIPPTPRCTAVSLAPEEKKSEQKTGRTM